MRATPYRAPSSARFVLHVAVIALLGAVLGTSILSSALTGSASSEGPSAIATFSTATATPVLAARAESSSERQSLDSQLDTVAPADNMMLAVLALESAKTSSEADASVQRILDLGIPAEAPAAADLKQTPSSTPTPTATPAGVLTALDAAPTSTATPEASACAETGSSGYCVYTVIQGDTLSGIAQQLGFSGNESITAAEMLAQSNKPDITSSDHIEPGQNIRVPREPGILHTVLSAETASDIATKYGVSLDSILSSPYNAVSADGTLLIGQEVFIPSPAQLPVNQEVEISFDEPTPVAEATDVPVEEPTETEVPSEGPATVVPPAIPPLGPLDTATPEPTPTATPAPTEAPAGDGNQTGSSFFIWPVHGPISSYFGPSHPLGIDIDLYADPNADIVAARGGKVTFAGGDPCCSYGYYVVIDHGNDIQTLYAHFSKIVVSEGQQVTQGQLLGLGGRTGYATGNHLHFEIHVNGSVVDPLKYLP